MHLSFRIFATVRVEVTALFLTFFSFYFPISNKTHAHFDIPQKLYMFGTQSQ